MIDDAAVDAGKRNAEGLAARWFRWMGAVGIILSVMVFFLYVSGVLSPGISPSDSAALWSESSDQYLEDSGIMFTSGWFLNPADGYFFSTAALAILASTALPVLVGLAVFWFRSRDFVYGITAVLISSVLIFAIIGG